MTCDFPAKIFSSVSFLLSHTVNELMDSTILLLDPHPAIEAGIQYSLQPGSAPAEAKQIDFRARLDTPAKLMEAFNQHQPNVLITETRIRGRDVLRPLERVIEAHKDLKVIVYSAQEDSIHISRAAALGCYEYLPKTVSCDRLIAVVCCAIAGRPPAEDSLLKTTRSRMHRRKLSGNGNSNIPLTNREFQVLSHISVGMSNREIGKSLSISIETAKEHVQNVLKKLKVNDRTQAAVFAIRSGWC